jgi:hypothetical protein
VKQGVPELLINKALQAKAELVVLFLPADTSTEWFSKAFTHRKMTMLNVDLRFLQGRVKYTIDKRIKRVHRA